MPEICPNADHCPLISRREFVARGSLALAALALLGCTDKTSLTDPLSSTVTFDIADHPALANVGGIVRVDVTPRIPLALARTSDSTVEALALGCPHEGITVNIDGQPGEPSFVCPGHGAMFDIDGHWIGGHHTGNLHSYPTTFDQTTGVVTVEPG